MYHGRLSERQNKPGNLLPPLRFPTPQVETRQTGAERAVGGGEVEHLGTTVSTCRDICGVEISG